MKIKFVELNLRLLVFNVDWSVNFEYFHEAEAYLKGFFD